MIDNSIIDFCKQLEIYIQSDYYKSQISIGAFSTRFRKFLLENDRAKDHLFMIDVLKDDSNIKHELVDVLETISNSEYDGKAEDYAKIKLIELGIQNNEQDFLNKI